MQKVILTMLLTINLYALKLSVEELSWPSGTPFLNFLEQNHMPLSLFYNLSSEDKELAEEISAGLRYQILKDDSSNIHQVLIPVNDELQIHIYRNEKDIFKLELIPVSYKTESAVLNIKIERSIIQDIYDYTNSMPLAIGFRDAFKNENIDFRRIKKGDRVVIIYTQKRRMGRAFGTPDIQAAMFETRNKQYSVYKFNDKFYDRTGKDRERVVFIRPLNNARITSPFTLKRWHPILQRYKAHLGVDYGAPRGTPIKSSGDGTIKFVGSKSGYGRTIIISHGSGYETLYAHLNGFAKGLKMGQRVSQGKIIGYVGSSGISTGPHLHFGLYRSQKPLNPEKMLKVPKSVLDGKDGVKFKAIVKKYDNEIKEILTSNKTIQKEEKFQNFISF